MKNNLQNMVMIPKELFDKFKKLLGDETELTNTDKRLKAIMLEDKINEYDKWLMYRQAILQKPKIVNEIPGIPKELSKVSEKIDPPPSFISPQKNEKRYSFITNLKEQEDEKKEEEETSQLNQTLEEPLKAENRLNRNYALEELYDQKALSESGSNTTLKKITSPFSKKNYRVIENSGTGEQITVFLSDLEDYEDIDEESFTNSKILKRKSPKQKKKKKKKTKQEQLVNYRKNRLRRNPKQWIGYPN